MRSCPGPGDLGLRELADLELRADAEARRDGEQAARVATLCHCCCKAEAEIQTGWDDIRQLCAGCAEQTAELMADDEPEDARALLAKIQKLNTN